MATGGDGGSLGGSGATTSAATRINVVDPHLLVTMRDVMSDIDTAPRLKPNGGVGGGGGGGGGSSSGTAEPGQNGETPASLTSVIVPMPAGSGDGGAGGAGAGLGGQTGVDGGGGGSGAGGAGGVVVIITQSNSTDVGLSNKIKVMGGFAGNTGGSSQGTDGSAGEPGPSGSVVFIRV